MQLSLRSNVRDVERDLSDAARRQLPFATSVALNDTAKDIQKNETRRLSKRLDRPTPFTKRAYGVRRATKRRLEARVFVKPIQARYLEKQEDGGLVRPKGRALLVPHKARVNKYGNLPRGAVKRMVANPKVFSGTPKGGRRGPGLYERQGRNKRLVRLITYTKSARYRPRLGFKQSARKTAIARFPVHLQRALVKAWASRRR